MDLKEIEKVIEAAGLSVCPVCGVPFEKYHSRQKTCGAPECKKEHHRQYSREWSQKAKATNPVAFNKKKAEANKKWRAKQRAIEGRDEQLRELQGKWERQKQFDQFITEHGHEYGKLSAEKVLATVPKIDVNLEKK